MSNITFHLSMNSSLAEGLAKTVGCPDSLKPVPVITTSSACVPDGLIGLDGSVFKGLRFVWSLERSGISGGTSWTGSLGCGREVSDAGICCSGSWTLGSSAGLITFAFLLGFACPLHGL